jgi:hypothetical protein
MNSFEQEFYRSSWHRVLPLGPYGIEPYVGTGDRPALRAGRPGWRYPATGLDALAQGLVAFGRRTAIAAGRPAAVAAASRK